MTPSERKAAIIDAEAMIVNGAMDEAIRICSKVLNEDANYVPAIFTIGRALMKQERYGLAYVVGMRAVDILPHDAAVWNNTGMSACAIPEMLDEGERMLRKALKIEPGNTAAMNNMCLTKVHQCDPQQAIYYADKSLAINPKQPEVRESRGYAKLMLGEWGDGWDGFEAAVGVSKYRKEFSYNGEPRWEGQTGGKLIVREEQGIGDVISFASVLEDAAKDNQITLDVDRRILGLFKRSFPYAEVHGTRRSGGLEWTRDREWDYHCLIGSLAQKYRRTADSFPGKPYLVADPDRRAQWRLLLDRLPGRKIGIAWTGGLANTFRHRRSLNLEAFLPLLRTSGCSFVSLQYRDPADEIAALKANHGITVTHWERAAQAQDYDETAALVAELDEVISVTTAAVHLAGALGKQCSVLIPKKPRWFYGLEGERTPWYDSVRYYRQTNNWQIEKIASELKERCGNH